MKHIVSFSGGKDSTAMLLMMLEKGMPIDDIIFVEIMATDTLGAELPETYQYIEEVENYIGRKITRLKPKYTFEEFFYKKKEKGNYIGEINAFPYLRGAWCNSRLKLKPLVEYYRTIKDDFTVYVGIAADEPKRLKSSDRLPKRAISRFPLAEWGITEKAAKDYLKEKNLLNPLYEKYERLGCWFCCKSNIKTLRNIYHDYPEYWQLLRKWQKDSYLPFKIDKSIFDFEQRFKEEDEKSQVKLF